MDYELISKMLDKTYAWAFTRTFSREEAEELTQEIIYQALRSIRDLRDGTKFEPWFWRLADITLKVFKRGKAKNRSMLSFDDVDTVAFEDEHSFIIDEQVQIMRHRIAQMSAAYRDIIVLYYYDNLSCKAISQKLGIPEGTVTYRLSLARDRLKKECNQMNVSALKPRQLQISITGEFGIDGGGNAFPWHYVDDALSQNILLHAYREPKTVEQLSRLTGVPAFYIEDRVHNLIKREAVIQPSKSAVQTNFLIFDEKTSRYSVDHSHEVVNAVSERFYDLSHQLTEKVMSSGVQTSGRSFDEMLCLLSVMLLDHSVPTYKPTEYTRIERKYDGYRWDYIGMLQDQSCEPMIGIGIEKSRNNDERGKLAHYVYHFAPFTYRKMMYSDEIDVYRAIVNNEELDAHQKEIAAKLIAQKYLAKNEAHDVVCAVPVLTKAQYESYLDIARDIFAEFLPFYTDHIKRYLDGYVKLFPKHLKEAANRNGYHVFVAMFKAIVDEWIRSGKVNIPEDAVCDVLVMM